jgi:hypothetical protein
MTPAEQTMVQAEEALKKAKEAFDAADLALTNACKAYQAAKGSVEPYVPDFVARVSR